MQASVVIGKAERILADEGNDHTSAAAMLGWFNSAQRLVVMMRPDAKTLRYVILLQEGPHQTIPAGGLRLIKLVRNQDGRAISLISEEQLSDWDPSWMAAAPKAPVRHYTFDPLEPKAFDVYPPAVDGHPVIGVWSVLPAEVTAESQDIGLDDIFEAPLIHLTCYFAYLQDADDTANLALAEKHLNFAALALTGKTAADQTLNPAASQPAKVRPNVR